MVRCGYQKGLKAPAVVERLSGGMTQYFRSTALVQATCVSYAGQTMASRRLMSSG